ncbi:MAG: aldo/keto reductase [Phycisphaeraceae bacterium]|nr:aldo/keto reductase [Phycisphaeraceae bacterium]
MKYRTLGKSGIKVSEIGFGCWGIGGWDKFKDDSESLKALHRAFDLGVNFYDTAMGYGSEGILGQAFKDRRDKVVIATKISPKTSKWPTLDREPVEKVYPEDWIIQCTENSLKKLGTEYIDVQQFHTWVDPFLKSDSWWNAIQKLKKAGKIRAWGVSANDWNPYNTVGLVESGRADTIQVIYNLMEQRPAEKLLPAALKHKVGIIVRVPFEEGLLTGKIRKGHKFPEGDWRADFLTPERIAEAEPHIQAYEKELDGTYKDLPTLALKFILAHPAVSAAIPGMRKLPHVEANVPVSDLPAIPEAKLKKLESLKWFHGWGYPWAQKE